MVLKLLRTVNAAASAEAAILGLPPLRHKMYIVAEAGGSPVAKPEQQVQISLPARLQELQRGSGPLDC